MKTAHEITELETEEVSLVDKGANKKKRFPLWKSEGDHGMNDEIIQAVLETEFEGEGEIVEKAALDPKAVNAVKAMLRIASGFKDVLPTDALDKLAAAIGYPKPEEKEKPKKEEETMSKQTETKPVDEKTSVNKEVDAAVKANNDALEAIRKENEEIRKQLGKERDMRLEAEWTEKAKSDLSHFPGKTSAELGKILKALADVNPELADEQFKSMKAASDMIKSSVLLKSAGSTNPTSAASGDESAFGKLSALANGIVEKSNLEMTPEKAMARVLKSAKGAELYNQYLDEHPAQKSLTRAGA
jgi:hypothetical protein